MPSKNDILVLDSGLGKQRRVLDEDRQQRLPENQVQPQPLQRNIASRNKQNRYPFTLFMSQAMEQLDGCSKTLEQPKMGVFVTEVWNQPQNIVPRKSPIIP